MSARGRHRRIPLQPGDDVDEAPECSRHGRVAIEPERAPQVVVLIDEPKAGGHDADHLDRPVVQLDEAPHDVRVAAEAPLPQLMAEDSTLRSLGPVVLR